MFAATPTVADLSAAAKSVTIEHLIEFIFENPPDDLTTAQQLVLQTLIDVVSTDGVDAVALAAALARFTADEKTKLAGLAV